MKIVVQGKDMNITAGIRHFVEDKVKTKLVKIGDRVVGVRVYLENITRKKNDPHAAKATVEVEIPGDNIVVKEDAHDPYLAISEAIKAAQRRLRKIKDKKRTKNRES